MMSAVKQILLPEKETFWKKKNISNNLTSFDIHRQLKADRLTNITTILTIMLIYRHGSSKCSSEDLFWLN